MLLFGQPTKIALLIGISEYPELNGWARLHGAADARLMAETLKQQGFETILLLDSAAGKQGIVRAMNRLGARLKQGDLLFILFSGHGQQISDNNTPRDDEPDGYDECLIPYDCPYFDSTITYQGDLHLRDDELYDLLVPLRRKVGVDGQVFIAIDACHSGSASRAATSLHPELTFRGYSAAKHQSRLDLPGAVRPSAVSADANRLDAEGTAQNLSPLIAFFATAPGQLNPEVEESEGKFGSLSYFLAKALRKADAGTSYVRLFESVQSAMIKKNSGQTPTSEGNLNRLVFGGKLLGNMVHFPVASVTRPNFITIREGILHGLYPGTALAIYPPDTWDTTRVKPLAYGSVQKSDGVGARIELSGMPADTEILTGAWCFVRTFRKAGNVLSYQEQISSLREAQLNDDILDMDFRLMAFACDVDDNGRFIRDFNVGERQKGTYKYGDCFVIELKNNAQRTLYFNLLDFPGDQALLLIPDEQHVQVNYSVEPGKTWNSRLDGKIVPWWFDREGTEVFKVVYSDQPVYLSDAIPMRGSGGSPIVRGRLVETKDIEVQVLPR